MKTILILGGYGVFGGKLAAALARAEGFDVLVAGRDGEKARAFCAVHGGRQAVLDRDAPDFAAEVARLAPFAVVDCAGPFQAAAGLYRAAEAALACGAHYLDLSDDAAFTAGISRFDARARAAGLVFLSGASSTPALSSAVAADLAQGLEERELIETAILPGNRAPRGLSVVAAILAQVGKPLALWRGGRWREVDAWGGAVRLDLFAAGGRPLRGRPASFIGAPDLALFPGFFGARSVLFRAGLESRLMHYGLVALGRASRLLGVQRLEALAPALKRIAERLDFLGSDRGGMVVRVIGRDAAGAWRERVWTLIAEGGDGPEIPAIPARILLGRTAAGAIAAGARPCLAEFSLAEAEAALSDWRIRTERRDEAWRPLFAQALGADFSALPAPLRRLHEFVDIESWEGQADVERGSGFWARLVGAVIGLPPAGAGQTARVDLRREGGKEIWTRTFTAGSGSGAKVARFKSVLWRREGDGAVYERFGLMTFGLRLTREEGPEGARLRFGVENARAFGIAPPRLLLPASDTFEYVDAEGRFCFDVTIATPLTGPIARYRGWLVRTSGGSD